MSIIWILKISHYPGPCFQPHNLSLQELNGSDILLDVCTKLVHLVRYKDRYEEAVAGGDFILSTNVTEVGGLKSLWVFNIADWIVLNSSSFPYTLLLAFLSLSVCSPWWMTSVWSIRSSLCQSWSPSILNGCRLSSVLLWRACTQPCLFPWLWIFAQHPLALFPNLGSALDRKRRRWKFWLSVSSRNL